MLIVNNQLQVAKIKLTYIISLFLGLGLIIPVFVVRNVTAEHAFMLGLGILLLFYFIFLIVTKPEYIYMAENKGKLHIKNYPARPILRKYKAFEISLNSLSHFEIRKSFFGKKVDLTIWIKTKKGTGNYPPLSLSALSKVEQKKISKYLSEKSQQRDKNIIQL